MLHNTDHLSIVFCAKQMYYKITERDNNKKIEGGNTMIFSAFILCAMVGIVAGLMTAACESEN